jgi:uncharacterized protein YqfA (UPF0365 family)
MKLKFIIVIIGFLALVSGASCNKTNQQQSKQENVEEFVPLEENDHTSESDKAGNSTIVLIVVAALLLGPGLIFFFYYFIPLGLWYEAWLSKVKVSWATLIVMRWQKVPQDVILKIMIRARNAGLTLNARDLADHYLAQVNIETVVNTLIRAKNASLDIPLNELAAQYLARVDVEKVIHAQIIAKNANLDIPLKVLASHYLAKVDVEEVVDALIMARNAGYLEMELNDLKEHCLANGDVKSTVNAFVAARKADLKDFTFKDIAAIDLSGIDVMKAVIAAITPRVVETAGVTGIARDGIQLTMKLKITLRAKIKSIIGGASEETVLARVNESLATEIGNSESHHAILRSPFALAEKVEAKNLGVGTAFEIISIDVSDIQVGRDIEAELTMDRAKAQAEMAKTEVIKAEEKVQKAMAAAFLDGNLSVNEYHQMKNTEADTKMRELIGKSTMKNSKKERHEEDDKEERG